jgi:polyisoprenoid-binding protein YceI
MFRVSFIAGSVFCALAPIAQAATGVYAIEPTHTFVTFEIPHFATSTIRGRFDKTTGTVQFDRSTKIGKAEISIDTASINTGTEPFNKHMQGQEFFNTSKFPTAKFSADKFAFNGAKVSEVEGTLTMVGKTMPVTLRATNFNCYDSPLFKREVCGGDFETTIQRSQWGITSYLEYGFPDAVRLLIQIEAIKQ